MKKFLIFVCVLFGVSLSVFAQAESYQAIYDGNSVAYNPESQIWSTVANSESDITLVKKLYSGAGSYSQYYFLDGARAFTLNSDFEFIYDGMLVAVDNANLKYNKIIYSVNGIEEIPLSNFELQKMFPEAELIRLSFWSGDNKIWVTKGLLKKKQILIVNDTNKYYYNLTAKSKGVQDEDIRGLITLSRYGIYNFSHFGERNGKLIMYVR